jgi:septum site-determining protein MinD
MGETYLFLSGKGGTGKTTLSTSLAKALALKGKRTVLVDADIGLRCADLLLGMEDQILYDLSDVEQLRCTLEQALVRHPTCPNLRILSAPQMLLP